MSCGLHDAIRLEERGVPMALIVTDAFARSVVEQLEVISAQTFQPVWVSHPVAGLPPERVRAKAEAALAEIVARLTGGDPTAAVPAADARPTDARAVEWPTAPGHFREHARAATPISVFMPELPATESDADCDECAIDAAERGL